MGEREEGPGPVSWRIELTRTALGMLQGIKDARVRKKIAVAIDGLAVEPERQGKALVGELEGYRSLRAVGQRYRIIYRVERDRVVVIVIGVGIRKEGDRHDFSRLAQRLVRLASLKPTESD